MDALSVAHEVALDRLKTDTSALGAFTRQHAGAGDPSDPDSDLTEWWDSDRAARCHLDSGRDTLAPTLRRKTGGTRCSKENAGWGASEAAWALTQPSWAGTRERGRVRHTRQTEARCERRHMQGHKGWYSAEGPGQGQQRGHTRTQERIEQRARCDVHDIWRSYDHTFNTNTHVCERLSRNGDDMRSQTRRKRRGAAVTGWISHAAAARIKHLIAIPSKHKVATQ